ncbi:phage holin family protein [Pseudomonas sp. S9]|uniref:phage holin family protein n=1 Tax=Pseudomonas sp. S9 TaxID=686578 RepID=UPI0002556FEB|nr:phage holin family protein [Pseudomonas sp. S9]
MTQEQQHALTEMPVWVVLVIAVVAGFSGEMWRADKAGLRGWELFYRVILRAGASVVFGLATMLMVWASGAAVLVAAGLGFIVATMGADVASALYERWIAKRAGVCDVPLTPEDNK